MPKGYVIKAVKAGAINSSSAAHRQGPFRFAFLAATDERVRDEDGARGFGMDRPHMSDEGHHGCVVILDGVTPQILSNDRGFGVRYAIDVNGTGVVFNDDWGQPVGA
jgi:hypothetical protein